MTVRPRFIRGFRRRRPPFDPELKMNSRHLPVSALLLVLVSGSVAAQDTSAVFAPVVEMERAVMAALEKPDTAAFNRALGSDFVYVDPRGAVRWDRAKTTAVLMECPPGKWTVDNPVTTRVGSDLVVLTYMSSGDQTCGGQKMPSPVHSMSVWQLRGGKWVAVAHSETPAAPKQ
jgi:hypothetical protein